VSKIARVVCLVGLATIMCLQQADAGLVDSNAIGIRAVTGLDGTSMVLLLASGELVHISGTEVTTLLDEIPVPPTEVLVFEAIANSGCNYVGYLGPAYLITQTGILYYKPDCTTNWTNVGPLPWTGPVSTKKSSWATIKEKFRSK